jgi:excisionase family DNA binding protein
MTNLITTSAAAEIAAAVAAELEKHFTVEPTLNLTEAAEAIGISVTVMRQLCRERRIRAIRLDKSYRIRVRDINQYLADHTVQALPNSPRAPRADMEEAG